MRHVFFIMFLAVFFAGNVVLAADIIPTNSTGQFKVKTRSLKDMKFNGIIRQNYDFSCGSAALASLLTYHYNRPVTEKEVIESMLKHGDKEKIRREGFSLLDMKNYLATRGLRAEGYKEGLDKLARVGVPAIVLTNHKGYLHFVLVKGVTTDKVLVGDPSKGMRVEDREEFEKQWNNILFVIVDDMKTGRKRFNTEQVWNERIRGRLDVPLTLADLNYFTVFTAFTPGYF